MSLAILVMASFQDKEYTSQIEGCLRTWVGEAEKLEIPVYFFCGRNKSSRMLLSSWAKFVHLEVEDNLASATLKQWLGYRFLFQQEKKDYYLCLGSDNYVSLARTLAVLEKYKPEKAALIGGYAQTRTLERQVLFPSGGGGLILTRAALEQLEPRIEKYLKRWPKRCRKYNCLDLLPACDVSLADACWKEGIALIIERHFYLCSWRGRTKNSLAIFPLQIDQEKICVHHYLNKGEMLFYHHYSGAAQEFLELEKKYARHNLQALLFPFKRIYAGEKEELILYLMILNNFLRLSSRWLYISQENSTLRNLAEKFNVNLSLYQGEEVALAINPPVGVEIRAQVSLIF